VRVLASPNVGMGEVKTNVSAKLVALVKDKIREVQALCVALCRALRLGVLRRRSETLLLELICERRCCGISGSIGRDRVKLSRLLMRFRWMVRFEYRLVCTGWIIVLCSSRIRFAITLDCR
jgi:hypothetical protein